MHWNVLSLLWLSLLLFACGNQAAKQYAKEKQQYLQRYKENLNPDWIPISAGYNFTIELIKEGTYVKKVYYPPTRQLVSEIYHSDPLCKTPHGKITEWLDNGQKWLEGQYEEGKRIGTWTIYDIDEGFQKEQGQYIDNKKEGVWIQFNAQGNKIAEFEYQANVKNGGFKIYNTSGELVHQGSYQKGQLGQVEKLKEVNNQEVMEGLDSPPFLTYCQNKDIVKQKKCSDHRLSYAVYSKLKYPPVSQKHRIGGLVLSRFDIDKNGEVQNIRILRGVNDDIKKECQRVLEALPAWSPGKLNGKPVLVKMVLPIQFNLP